jgi:hypothetical protein
LRAQYHDIFWQVSTRISQGSHHFFQARFVAQALWNPTQSTKSHLHTFSASCTIGHVVKAFKAIAKSTIISKTLKIYPYHLQNANSGNFFGIDVEKEHSFPVVKNL